MPKSGTGERVESAAAAPEYATDDPITSSAQDLFARTEFAYRVAHTVAKRTDPSSLVVGIHGAWGEGKTSVLRIVDEALRGDPNVVSFWFNPWRYGDEESLLESFFRLMALALKKPFSSNAEKLGQLLDRYKHFMKPIAAVAGVSPADVDGAIDGLKDVTPEDLKERIDTALSASGVRLVIFLDDLDRLDHNEVRAVFRLIKLAVNFRNSAFIVAFDEDVVVDALTPQYGQSSRKFLEKIIQVPLQLPRPDPVVLRNLCFGAVDEALRLAGVVLDEDEARRFVLIFDRSLLPRITAPRSVRRYSNMISFALPIMVGEVNMVDLLLIEAVRLFYPKLYASFRDNRDLYVWSVPGHVGDGNEERRAARKSIITEAIGDSHGHERDAVIDLIERLFPMTAGLLAPNHITVTVDDRWTQTKRVASHEYFDRYFGYGIYATDISDRQFAAFCEQMRQGDAPRGSTALHALVANNRAERFLEKVRQNVPSLPNEACGALARCISAHSDLFVGRTKLGLSGLPETAAARVCWLIERAPSNDRLGIAVECVHATRSPSFAVALLRWLNPEGVNRPVLTVAEHDALAQEVGERIDIAAGDQPPWIVFGKDTPSILLWWARIAGRETVWRRLQSHFRADPRHVPAFLESMLSHATSLTTGAVIRRPFSHVDYRNVVAVADGGEIAKYLEELGIIPELRDEYEPPLDPLSETAERFLALHQAAVRSSDGHEETAAE